MTPGSVLPVSLQDIETAAERLAPVVCRTPLLPQIDLETPGAADLSLKAENLQRTGSFKFRGAYNTLVCLRDREHAHHVVTSSSGNHGQAVAAAGRLLGLAVTVVMPTNAVPSKVDGVRRHGGRVEFAGTTSLEREARAREIAEAEDAAVIGSFDDARIIAGQGTCGLEIADQLSDVDVVVVPVGGGGLISGIAIALKSLRPTVKVFGAEPSGAPDAYQSLATGKIQTIDTIDTIADGLRTSRLGNLTFEIIYRLVDGIVLVDDNAIRATMRRVALTSKLTAEPSGAVAVAAILSGNVEVRDRKVVAVVSGGNVDPAMFAQIVT